MIANSLSNQRFLQSSAVIPAFVLKIEIGRKNRAWKMKIFAAVAPIRGADRPSGLPADAVAWGKRNCHEVRK
jgi:hypothetical protein